jgi:hypothetical protein
VVSRRCGIGAAVDAVRVRADVRSRQNCKIGGSVGRAVTIADIEPVRCLIAVAVPVDVTVDITELIPVSLRVAVTAAITRRIHQPVNEPIAQPIADRGDARGGRHPSLPRW